MGGIDGVVAGRLHNAADASAARFDAAAKFRQQRVNRFVLCIDDGRKRGAIDHDAALRIRNSRAPADRLWLSNASPVSRTRLGRSMALSGSVQATSMVSPGAIAARILRVLKTGRGHFRPRRSSFFMLEVSSSANSAPAKYPPAC